MSEKDTNQSPVPVCLKQFGAFGVSYNPGDVITNEHLKAWPSGALANRLTNGYVHYAAPPVSAEEDNGTDVVPLVLPPDAKASKKTLQEWVDAQPSLTHLQLNQQWGLPRQIAHVEATLAQLAKAAEEPEEEEDAGDDDGEPTL